MGVLMVRGGCVREGAKVRVTRRVWVKVRVRVKVWVKVREG